ncbi:P-loop containing nucleoside triphosphate hydrolase protein [Blastocladiella britannica]|nr:P-loop containing nucleoside triphosphate hydrolase protein [Blastocladiella britannica]
MPPSPSLIRALWGAFGWKWLWAGILSAVAIVAQIGGPLLLNKLLLYFGIESFRLAKFPNMPSTYDSFYGYGLAIGLFALAFVSTMFNSVFFFISMKIGMRLRSALMVMVYDKSLRLSAKARSEEFNPGKITNIVATDCARLDMVTPYVHIAWTAPIQIFVVLGLLINYLGVSVLAGFGLMIAFMPIQGKVMQSLTVYRKEAQLITDKRVKLMNEILQGSRIVKLMSWESAVTDAIMELRSQELGYVKKLAMWRAGINGVAQAIPALAATLVFAVYSATGNQLTPALVFPAFALFQQLRLPLMFLPMVIAFTVDALVAIQRIKGLLLAQELETQPEIVSDDAPNAIEIKNADFEWNDGQTQLHDVNLAIPKGKLVAIVGAVGSGKSSLLSGLVGEMKRTRGDVYLSGTFGYAPQQPWLMNATLKQNVLFSQPFDQARYRRAIELGALERDLDQLPAGDATEIGEKGINLSGGQKARINLSRAIYYDADTILLDDPIAAVDAHVGKKLFNTIVNDLRGKTRVLVTHALHFVPQCDYVVYLKDGRITEQGTYAELMANDQGDFSQQMKAFGGLHHDGDDTDDEDTPVESPTSAAAAADLAVHDEPSPDAMRRASATSLAQKKKDVPADEELAKRPGAAGKLMKAEERATGSVNLNVYRAYFAAMGGLTGITAVMFLLILTQLLRVGNDYWLTWWTEHNWGHENDDMWYLQYYCLWAVGQAAAYVLSGIQFAVAGVQAAKLLHRGAVFAVMRSPMSFYESTPLGQIINRFSKDQDAMDNTLADSFRMFLGTLFMTLSTFVVIINNTPLFAAPLAPLIVVYYYVQLFYRHTSRELKRLDSLSRSPLYANLGETLTGVPTIRAYREEHRFIARNEQFIDGNNGPIMQQMAAQRWLSIRIESIGSALILAAAVFSVLSLGSINASSVGLSLSYSMSITGVLNWCVRQAAEVEVQMNSVERVYYYASELKPEAPQKTDVVPPSAQWPEHGEIKFTDVSMSYRPDLPPVLIDVNLNIKPGSKVGIVGRTGAGKSTALVVLFRLVELAKGKIEIDGVDISKLGLHDLRSRLAIIPQDPVLFSGSVRSNLDRFNEADDQTLWDCLERAGLKDYVDAQENKLDAPIAENGENLSVGQRQLLCLARAMVRRSKVLVMDEATASVDLDTDAFIQRAIRRDFAAATVLTIAHRLNTIIDYDTIICMDAGRVKEFGAPSTLLSDPNSLLSSLVDETGATNAALLRRMALEKQKANSA